MRQAQIIKRLEIGGWNVVQMKLPKGNEYHAIVFGKKSREDLGYSAVWIKGLIEGRNLRTGESLSPRRPWVLSSDLPEMSIGRLEFKAIEDTEWLCFDAKLNRGFVPQLSVVENIDSGGSIPLYTQYQLGIKSYLIVPKRSF